MFFSVFFKIWSRKGTGLVTEAWTGHGIFFKKTLVVGAWTGRRSKDWSRIARTGHGEKFSNGREVE